MQTTTSLYAARTTPRPGGAPEPQRAAEQPGVRTARAAPTPRLLWLVLYGLLALLALGRAPAAYADLTGRVPADISAEIGDPHMQALALKVGTVLAVLVYLFAMAVYLSLAALLERRMFRVGVPLGRGRTVGLFFLVAALCTLPVQAFGLASGDASPPKGLLHLLWFFLVAGLTPLLFVRTLRALRPGRVVLL